MIAGGSFIVVDIGKTLAKVTLWTAGGELVERKVRPNAQIEIDGIRRLDLEGIATWLTECLAGMADKQVDSIIPVGHGAGFVAIGCDVPLFAPLDYEQPIPDSVLNDYRAQRNLFAETGSPMLPNGLNLGSQLYWSELLYPREMARATLLPWAQYWAMFLSGEAVSEVSSLGCHTDLWAPAKRQFSSMAQERGWSEKFAPLARADLDIGTLRPALARLTGLSPRIRVLTGLHDSNAALLAARSHPEIDCNEATVLSTGTWFIAMRLTERPVDLTQLPEGRDCLVNVDPFGKIVPSGRFMGGREIEKLIEIDTRQVDIRPDQPALLAAVDEITETGAMVLPTLAKGSGPFADRKGGWKHRPDNWFARRAGACLYAGLVVDETLRLVGTSGRLLVEGRFAEADVFVRTIASLRRDLEVLVANTHNDVSFGAIRLVRPELRASGPLRRVEPLVQDVQQYRAKWLEAFEKAA